MTYVMLADELVAKDGKTYKAGEVIEVSAETARVLIHRGQARSHSVEEVEADSGKATSTSTKKSTAKNKES